VVLQRPACAARGDFRRVAVLRQIVSPNPVEHAMVYIMPEATHRGHGRHPDSLERFDLARR